MIKDLQITLYEIFGYVFPGALMFVSFAFAWGVFVPDEFFDFSLNFSKKILLMLVLLAYLIGHLAQAIGNLLEKIPFVKKAQSGERFVAPEIMALVKASVAKRFGNTDKDLIFLDLYAICDQALVHDGSFGEREIFTYREGFYRGCAVGFIFFTASFILISFKTPSPIPSIAVAILSAIVAWLMYERYQRFYRYRIKSCLLRFLALSTANS